MTTAETKNAGAHEDADLVALFGKTKTESGRTLLSLLDENPMLLIFLRHFGCSFCREAIADVARAMPELNKRGVRPVFVHMGKPERAQIFFARFRIPEIERVSDPRMALYQNRIFRLLKTVILPEYFGLDSIAKWLQRPLLRYGVGMAHGEDKTQLPGVFFLRDRTIVKGYRHKKLADRPDYMRLGS